MPDGFWGKMGWQFFPWRDTRKTAPDATNASDASDTQRHGTHRNGDDMLELIALLTLALTLKATVKADYH